MSNHNTYKIGAILEIDGITTKQSHQYRVGKSGTIDSLNEGSRVCFKYSDGHGILITSPIVEYAEDDYGVWITTVNSMYRLNQVYEEVNNDCDKTRVMENININ
ncbi:hypothetical protein [Clostridium sp.]|uniref:hypothetical protein n=1 Tax=Clostridium sp. TaxID=1506 RepID=UPI001A56B4E5|nr:hypothetical protein [Clostridium sp.]MBK5243182.1 hypothetical protein [Clostridium sp.]